MVVVLLRAKEKGREVCGLEVVGDRQSRVDLEGKTGGGGGWAGLPEGGRVEGIMMRIKVKIKLCFTVNIINSPVYVYRPCPDTARNLCLTLY